MKFMKETFIKQTEKNNRQRISKGEDSDALCENKNKKSYKWQINSKISQKLEAKRMIHKKERINFWFLAVLNKNESKFI